MNILLYLIPISLFLGGMGLLFFVITVRTKQYDDPEGNAARILSGQSGAAGLAALMAAPSPAPVGRWPGVTPSRCCARFATKRRPWAPDCWCW